MTGRQKKAGFSLLELSVVLTIIAVITAMGMSMGNGMIESAKRAQTNNKLNVIEDVLMSYRTAYNRLPCPTDPTIGNTSANYGVEAANPGSCTGGSPAIAAAATDATNKVVEGAVPFQALGLPEEFMYDGWGRKFAYAVNYNATAANAMLGESLSDMCGISLTNAGGAAGARSNKGAIYALVSYGPDGHGGYLRSGSRNNAGSTNTDELTNCHCNTATAAETTYAANYVEKDPTLDPNSSTDQFGDYVRFSERWQMATADDFYTTNGTGVCTPNYGIRIDGDMAGLGLGSAGMWVADINGDGIPDLIINGADDAGTGNGALYVIFGQSSRSGFTPNPFPLSSLNGTNGFKIVMNCYGNSPGSWTPVLIGDINGDGINDILINFAADTNGGIPVILGQASGWPAVVDICTLTPSSNPKGKYWFNPGTDQYGNNGASLTVADVNGDGIADLIIGNTDGPGAVGSEGAGDVFVVFGNSNILTNFPQNLEGTPTGVNGTNGFHIESDRASIGLGGNMVVGDFNGDGINDIAISAPSWSAKGDYAYIIWGHAAAYVWPSSGVVNLGALPANGSVGFEINKSGSSIDSGKIGFSVVAAGDVNSDGIADLIGANVDYAAGSDGMLTFFGTKTWPASNSFSVTSLNGSNGSAMVGSGAEMGALSTGGGWSGVNYSLSIADINGDGIKDIVGQGQGYSASCYNWAFFVKFGAPTGSWASPFATNFNGTNGFAFCPTQMSYNNQGYWPSYTTGDVNGDGIADVVMGDYNVNSGAGAVYVVKGGMANYNSGQIGPSNMATYGYTINGDNAGDNAGYIVGTGDFDHDGTTDLVIAAPGASPSSKSVAGSVYVIWGSKTLPALLNLSTVTR
jgi:prepilin-type N-terminal cleavage/methylation domain-containing protein